MRQRVRLHDSIRDPDPEEYQQLTLNQVALDLNLLPKPMPIIEFRGRLVPVPPNGRKVQAHSSSARVLGLSQRRAVLVLYALALGCSALALTTSHAGLVSLLPATDAPHAHHVTMVDQGDHVPPPEPHLTSTRRPVNSSLSPIRVEVPAVTSGAASVSRYALWTMP